jgi:photosystem II stability/assembly factor-like uncharacterized protein
MKAKFNVFAQLVVVISISYSIQAQWVQTNGPIGGDISALAMKDTLIFAGTLRSGIAVSSDKGKSWKLRNNGLPGLNVSALAILNNSIYAAMDGSGIYRSMDNGLSWTQMNDGLTSMYVSIFASIGDTIFAGTNGGGIYYSDNKRVTWTQANNGLKDLHIRGGLIAKGTDLFTAPEDGVFKSTDRGASWIETDSGLTCKDIRALGVVGSDIWAGAYDGHGAFLSKDNGSYWSFCNNGLHSDTSYFGVTFSFFYSFSTMGNNIFAGTNSGIYRLTNNQASWKLVPSSNTFPLSGANTLLVNGLNLFVGYKDTIFLTADTGASWSQINISLKNVDIFTLAVSDKYIFAGTQGRGIFLSDNDGDSWTAANNGLSGRGLLINTIFPNNNNVFVGTYGAGIFLSKNNGVSWSPMNNGLNQYGLSVNAIAKIGTTIIIGTDNNSGGFYLSDDTGNSWKARHINISSISAVTSLAVNGNNIFAGTSTLGVFRSSDSGKAWVPDTIGLTSKNITSLLIKDSTIFAGTNTGGVFKSKINGSSWTAANNGLSDPYVTALTTVGDTIFLGTGYMSGGVYFSSNNGDSWVSMNDGMTNGQIYGLAVKGRNIFAGTLGNSVWRRSLNNLVSIKPYDSRIQNSWENIINLRNRILQYSLPKSCFISIRVYDIKGKLIYSVANNMQSAGLHSLSLSTMNFSSGSYIIEFDLGGYKTQKCIPVIR